MTVAARRIDPPGAGSAAVKHDAAVRAVARRVRSPSAR